MNGYDIILNYCNQFSQSAIEHMENCIWNKRHIEKGEYSQLVGCPQNYGHEDAIELCEIDDMNHDLNKQMEQCEDCWRKALGV